MTPGEHGASGSGAPLPPLTATPLGASVLPAGALVRVVAAPPPLQLLSILYGPDDQAALAALAATDPVLRRELGGVHLVQPSDWPHGPGASWVLAPFVRMPSPATASRFSDGGYGVWYGSETLATAQAEVGHHLSAYLARTSASPGTIPRTALRAVPNLACPVIDLRSPAPVPSGVLAKSSYAASQPFGAACRKAQQWGIVWPSVRRADGTCVAVLRPPVLVACDVLVQCHALWDGRAITWAS